ncbi:Ankyrin-3 [Colletotrichum siamense]|nr:Ankyrin-3 [Colletotrichum siamense]
MEIVTEVLKRATCIEESEVGRLYATALYAAAQKRQMGIVTRLLDEGADVNLRGAQCGNALLAAAEGGDLDIVELVLNKGADVNAERGQSETALHAASSRGWRHIAARLLAEGARADKQDIWGFYPLELAVKHGHHQMANDLLPESTHLLALIKASQWKACYGDGNDDLELSFDGIPAIRKVWRNEFSRKSYPLGTDNEAMLRRGDLDFMANNDKIKRIFLLADGTRLLSQKTGYRCWSWETVNIHTSAFDSDTPLYWKSFDWIDRKSHLSQLPKADWFVECRFATISIALTFSDTATGHLSNSTPAIESTSKTHGFCLIMTKSETATASQLSLEPRVFFTTSEYAQEPPRASVLLVPLMDELQGEWEKTFETAQDHLSKMRMSLLKARGLNSDLIQVLLEDSLLWDRIEQACRKQVLDLKELQKCWKSTSTHESEPQSSERTLQEDNQGSEEWDLKAFGLEVEKLQTFHEVELKVLKETSQSLIQLEFNLTSIAEAQLSRSNNMSMKRLSWITFIFLPLMFVASVFGMNIDALASNPNWRWPVILAIPTAAVAFSVVL